MRGLTTRGYAEVVRELKEAYGVEKSTVSEQFIEGSWQRLQQLETHALGKHSFCALFLDGTYFQKQQLIVALGLPSQREKMVLSCASEAPRTLPWCASCSEKPQERGIGFDVLQLYVLDFGKA